MPNPNQHAVALQRLLAKLKRLPLGYSEGTAQGRYFGVTISRDAGGRRWKLFARSLSDKDHLSFNLYVVRGDHILLKPCEIPEEKVTAFVDSYEPIERGLPARKARQTQ